MSEYVGYKDPIGENMFSMGLTDEEVIRCRACKHMDEIQPETNQPCSTDPNGFCSWAVRRS